MNKKDIIAMFGPSEIDDFFDRPLITDEDRERFGFPRNKDKDKKDKKKSNWHYIADNKYDLFAVFPD